MSTKDRNNRMLAMFRSGKTLDEIGSIYGITRARVHQIIKRNGLTKSDGGFFRLSLARKTENARRMASARDSKALSYYGCSFQEFVSTNGSPKRRGSLADAYLQQKKNAAARGVKWAITFPEWVSIWIESGHIHERGKGYGYCMARFGDEGPYAKGNVYIATCATNASDYQMLRLGRTPSYETS